MSDIGQIKGTNIKRGNSGLDPKTFDINKELLDAMRIIARQEIDKAPKDITKTGKIIQVNQDGTVTVEIDNRTYGKVPNYNGTNLSVNSIVKVTYPQGQASNMYISGGGVIEETIKMEISGITTYGQLQLNSESSDQNSLGGSRINFYGKGGNTGKTNYIDSYNDFLRIISKDHVFTFADTGLYDHARDGYVPIASPDVGTTLLEWPRAVITLVPNNEYDICSLNLSAGKWIVWASSLGSGDYSLKGVSFGSMARNYRDSSTGAEKNVVVIGYLYTNSSATVTFHIGARAVQSVAHADPNYCYLRALRIQ